MITTKGKRRAAATAAIAFAGVMTGTTPASAATSHNLMLYVDMPVTHIRIVPEADVPEKCVAVKGDHWVSANFSVKEGERYTFQVLVNDQGRAGGPCGGGSRYLGISADSPLRIPRTTTVNFWEKIRLP